MKTKRSYQAWVIIGAVTINLCVPLISQAEDVIQWMVYNMPPYFIVEGKDVGKGNQDEILRILQQQLPEYTHKTVVSNMTRAFEEAKNGTNVCMPALIKTSEREAFLAYGTVPTSLMLPYHLIVKKTRKEEIFGAMAPITFQSLLQNSRLMFGTPTNRSYGERIDALLKPYKEQNASNFYNRPGTDLKGLLQMLEAERVDYILAHPPEVAYAAQQVALADQIAMVPFQESQEDYLLLYPACAKTDWGKQTISKITQVVQAERLTDRYRLAVEGMTPPELLPALRQLYQTRFLEVNP